MANTRSYLEQTSRDRRREFIRRWWWLLGLVFVVIVGMFLALAFTDRLASRWLDRETVVAFFLGTGLATGAALVWRLLDLDGGRSYRDGIEAESWTSQALKPLRRAGSVEIRNVDFGAWDIDHVLVGSSGVLAVETKYRSCEIDLEGKPPLWLEDTLATAAFKAGKLRRLLLAGGVQTEVRAAVVLWGARISGSASSVVDGVLVVRGKDADTWLEQLEAAPLTDEEVELAVRAVQNRKDGTWVRRPLREFKRKAA